MAKLLHDNVIDAALDVIATSTHLNFCSSQPTNYSDISTYTLANVTLTAGDGNGDYTITDDTSGRKLTITEQTGIVPTSAGTSTHISFDDGSNLIAVTTMTSQVFATEDSWICPSFKINIPDPA